MCAEKPEKLKLVTVWFRILPCKHLQIQLNISLNKNGARGGEAVKVPAPRAAVAVMMSNSRQCNGANPMKRDQWGRTTEGEEILSRIPTPE